MLQQTRVETVTGYYERFLEAFPDIQALAAAPEERVMALWQGLGYYSRARNLQKAARQVVTAHAGVFPGDPQALVRLAGIGPYTAGAIASIAFDIPTPAVDGNVLRVVARLQVIEENILSTTTRARITALVREMIPPEHAADFCQGMMELGATCCTPASPACPRCPVQADCGAYLAGLAHNLPVRAPKAPPVASHQAVFLIRDPRGSLLLVYRPEGLLRGLWGLPHMESEAETPDVDQLMAQPALRSALTSGSLVLRESAGACRHVFTHRHWHMRIWWVDFLPDKKYEDESDGYKWLPERLLGSIPIPEAFRKVLRFVGLEGCEKDVPIWR